jgi:hypothetical protein
MPQEKSGTDVHNEELMSNLEPKGEQSLTQDLWSIRDLGPAVKLTKNSRGNASEANRGRS